MVKGELVGDDKTINRLESMPGTIRQQIDATMTRLAIQLTADVKEKKLSGQVLNVRSGRLRRSVHYTLEGLGTGRVTAHVGTDVVYARPHEYGGEVRGHIFPERSFLRSMLGESGEEIKLALNDAVRGAIK